MPTYISEQTLPAYCMIVKYWTHLSSGTGLRTCSNSSFTTALRSAVQSMHKHKRAGTAVIMLALQSQFSPRATTMHSTALTV